MGCYTNARRRAVAEMMATMQEERRLERLTMPEECPDMPNHGHDWEAGIDGAVCRWCDKKWSNNVD